MGGATQRIFFDGLNLALEHGTGIATYTRTLTKVAADLGHRIGLVYSSPRTPAKDPVLREIGFFDARNATRGSRTHEVLDGVVDTLRYNFGVAPVPVDFSGVVVAPQIEERLPRRDQVFAARNLFANSRRHFAWTGKLVEMHFPERPDILHCTYQLPLRVRSARNIYTIHDLVPLRLPFATLDNKRLSFRLLKKIAEQADHIVTVSEHSKHDIMTLLGVEPRRITNTYEAVNLPPEYLERSPEVVSQQLSGSFGLEYQKYLLFFGALEPKKNVRRLMDAYLLSGVDMPLILVASGGWDNDGEKKFLAEIRDRQRQRGGRMRRGIHQFEYLGRSMLVTLIKGACAVVFPSLYEGFGLPVLESMMLGTPVLTSRESSLPEIAGDAALLVNPYDTEEIAKAIRTIVEDADLRQELLRRAPAQAEKFSLDRYRARVATLYDGLR